MSLPVPSQRRVRYIGGFKNLLMRTTSYIAILNFLMIAVTAYYTTVRYFLPIPFAIFMLCLVLLVFVAMLIEWRYVLPSEIRFLVWQQYIHENPLVRDVKELKEAVKRLEREMKQMK